MRCPLRLSFREIHMAARCHMNCKNAFNSVQYHLEIFSAFGEFVFCVSGEQNEWNCN
jgi:hypothetical protein